MNPLKKPSFAGGELSPALWARTDINRYAIGLRTLRNFIISKQGGAVSRPGTEYVGEASALFKVTLVPFVTTDGIAHLLEFGHLYLRVWRGGALVTVTTTPWSSATTYSLGETVSHGGVNYYATAVGINREPPNASFWSALNGNILQVPTPYLFHQIADIRTEQIGDTLVIVHPSHRPRILARTTTGKWTISEAVFLPGIAAPLPRSTHVFYDYFQYPVIRYRITAVSVTGEESLAYLINYQQEIDPRTTSHKFSWKHAGGAVSFNIYREYEKARTTDTDYGLTSGRIGQTTAFSYVAKGEEAVVATWPTDPDPFVGADNYPSIVKLSQQRLFFAGTKADPESVDGSRIGSFFNFTKKTPVLSDDSLSFTLTGSKLNRIRSLVEARKLLALTESAEFVIEGDISGVLKPDSINPKRHSHNGSDDTDPAVVDGSVIYVQARSSALRDTGYNYEADGYVGNDLSVFSAHLFENRDIVDITFAQVPDSILWVVMSDGSLLSLTYVREHEMLAWARHDTDGIVENVAVVPEGNEDRVYIVVKRTISGAERRYIERLHPRQFSAVEDLVLMDCSKTYTGTPISFVTGLAHLEGKDVAIIADGVVIASPNNPAYPKMTVIGGSLTLPRAYSNIHIGLPYVCDFETLGIDSFQGEKKLITKAEIFVKSSRGIWAGQAFPSGANAIAGLREAKLRTTEPLNEPPALKTEPIMIQFESSWSMDGRFVVRQVDPVPLTILSVTPLGFVAHGGR